MIDLLSIAAGYFSSPVFFAGVLLAVAVEVQAWDGR